MKRNLKLAILLAYSITLTNCSSDELSDTVENCKLATVTNYDGTSSGGEEVMNVTYDGDLITKLEGPTLRYTYTYNANGKLKSKLYEELINSPIYDDLLVEYDYNSAGKISEERFYFFPADTGLKTIYAKTIFTYNGSQLSSSDYWVDIDSPGDPNYVPNVLEFNGTNNYTYTGNNITKLEFFDSNNQLSYIYNYYIDTTAANPVASQFSDFYTLDTYIDDDTHFFLPMYLNQNKVISYDETEVGYSTYPETIGYSFTTSPNGNTLLTAISNGGDDYYKFTYNCN